MRAGIKKLLENACQQLADSLSARLDAEVLLAHVLNQTRSFLYANPEMELPLQSVEDFSRLIKQRADGQPIAYLTGQCEFWSLPLRVTRDVLIPRPETELLVEVALQRIPAQAQWRIADLGTGSGAIAIALAAERKNCEIHATDSSDKAILLARENCQSLGLEHVHFHPGSWSHPLTGKFDMILSNPPYIDATDPCLQQGDLRFEPRQALTPGEDGVAAIREISRLVEPLLIGGGWLLLEHGWEQGASTRKIMQAAGFAAIETRLDLQGHERMTIGRKTGCAGSTMDSW